MIYNQAVIFTKPVHHLGIELSPQQLSERAQTFFKGKGFQIRLQKTVTGMELAEREVIKQHYCIYSAAACADVFKISESGKAKFKSAFGKAWDDELKAGRILSTANLLKNKGIDAHQLFKYWNGLFANGGAHKIEDGLIIAWIEALDDYCVNAFYPSMEANFYNPETRIDYFVVEFDPAEISWEDFRKKILGSTNASEADPESFRGQLYAEFPVTYPGRDNFVHGSAGPLEGFIERTIHEADFDAGTNPIGEYLIRRGITRAVFDAWKANLSISELGAVFDATEEQNTADVIPILENIEFDRSLDNDRPND